MFKQARPLFLICETPLHVGSGDNLGIIDLPIQRERHTGFPKVESSSLKGSLRTAFEEKAKVEKEEATQVSELVKVQATFGYDDINVLKETKDKVDKVFAPKEEKPKKEPEPQRTFVGCLGFTDARVLLFPVKSMKGVFAWVTCPQVLKKFADEMRLCGHDIEQKATQQDENEKDACRNLAGHVETLSRRKNNENEKTIVVPDSCELVVNNKQGKQQIVLEEFTFEVTQDKDKEGACSKLAECLAKILFSEKQQSYWKGKLEKNLVVLSNDDFRDFVEHSTEVITRTKINNGTGTVQDGALFTEEFLPTDSILYSLVLASPIAPIFLNEEKFSKVKEFSMFKEEGKVIGYFGNILKNEIENIFQLGGNATLGKGIVRTVFLNGENGNGKTNGTK